MWALSSVVASALSTVQVYLSVFDLENGLKGSPTLPMVL